MFFVSDSTLEFLGYEKEEEKDKKELEEIRYNNNLKDNLKEEEKGLTDIYINILLNVPTKSFKKKGLIII